MKKLFLILTLSVLSLSAIADPVVAGGVGEDGASATELTVDERCRTAIQSGGGEPTGNPGLPAPVVGTPVQGNI